MSARVKRPRQATTESTGALGGEIDLPDEVSIAEEPLGPPRPSHEAKRPIEVLTDAQILATPLRRAMRTFTDEQWQRACRHARDL